MNRFLLFLFSFSLLQGFAQNTEKNYYTEYYKDRPIVVIMFDGFGMSYFNTSKHPNMDQLIQKGFFKEVDALMPTVTNCNNVSICTGTFPDENGVTGNSFLDEHEHEEYMESKELLNAPTLFEKLSKYNRRSALISSKKKSLGLLSGGTEFSLSPETADTSWLRRIGQPASIYSPEVNYWTMEAALYVLKNKKEINCLYIHTTDYPMHTWAPEDTTSLKHVAKIDYYIGEILKAAPNAIILLTADHDVNHKSRCVDLEKSLAKQNLKIKIAISAERDKYLKHHRGFGGTSYVYLNKNDDAATIKKALENIAGVKTVMTKAEAAKKYHLNPQRIGDLVVFSDEMTVFGNLEGTEENLPATYRSHGSEYEIRVPLLILNAGKLPPASFFQYNKDLTRWLFEKP